MSGWFGVRVEEWTYAGLTKGQQLWDCGVLLAAVERRAVGSSESRRLQQERRRACTLNIRMKKIPAVHLESQSVALCNMKAHNFAKTLLELDVGLTLVVDAGFAVLASQCKLIVHWRERKSNTRANLHSENTFCKDHNVFWRAGNQKRDTSWTHKLSCARRRHKTSVSCSSGPWTCGVCRWPI